MQGWLTLLTSPCPSSVWITTLAASCESWTLKSVHRQACVYIGILIFTPLSFQHKRQHIASTWFALFPQQRVLEMEPCVKESCLTTSDGYLVLLCECLLTDFTSHELMGFHGISNLLILQTVQ